MLSNSSDVVLKYILHLSQLMPKEKSEYLKLLLFHLEIVHNIVASISILEQRRLGIDP